MPIRQPKNVRAIVVGVVGLLVGISVVIVFIILGQRGDITINVEEGDLNVGKIKVLENQLASGGPVLIENRNNSAGSVYISKDEFGEWVAFSQQVNVCNGSVVWPKGGVRFEYVGATDDPCASALADDTLIFGMDGCLLPPVPVEDHSVGLTHYPTRIEKDGSSEVLLVELKSSTTGFCFEQFLKQTGEQ